jgi:hypothetical protein
MFVIFRKLSLARAADVSSLYFNLYVSKNWHKLKQAAHATLKLPQDAQQLRPKYFGVLTCSKTSDFFTYHQV